MKWRALVLLLLLGPSADAQEPIVVGTGYELVSKILGETRRYNVYRPPGHAESEESYPVLYLLDGGVNEDFIHVAGIASLAAEFRKIRPFLVVGIEGIDRYHDLLPPTRVDADKERLPTAGGAADFRRFLVEELQPAVRERFRVTDESVLLGESVAGHFVVETLFEQPRAFTGYAAVSPSLWWNDRSLERGLGERLGALDLAGRSFFLTLADEGGEMEEAVGGVAAALEAAALPGFVWRYEPMPEESHGTILHPAALEAVRWLFATDAAKESLLRPWAAAAVRVDA
ncbi:MAG: alpha/beta hydrolase-fold protein [Acidobacteriota bacterium]